MASLPTNVRPGDVISSDFINLLLSELVTIEQRLTALEAGGTTPGTNVTIASFDPPNQQNAGQILTITGTNFAFPPTDNQVTLDDAPVTAFRPDSTSTILKFIVPTTLNLPTAGRNVKVTIINAVGSTSALYRILPAVPVVGIPPIITNVAASDGGAFLRVGQPIIITGQNFAATPTDNILTFQVMTANGPVIYPKVGQTLQINTGQSSTTQIVVTIPDIAEITAGGGTTPVTLQVGVGAQVPAARNILVIRG
ncbi:MAG: IPT/TIG domain-containing protein [Chloroflexota bacterium]